jgi:HK97 family phage major capsid protein/HK97 family phage prohead protease
MDKRDIKPDEKFFRTVQFRAPALAEGEEDDRRVEIAVSSELPVDRWFGTEILAHEPGAIRMDFMGSGSAPLLLDHNHSKQIGVIESARLDDDKVMRATVRFSKSALASEILQDIRDGIRSNVSVGYQIEKIERDEKKETVRVVQWYPFEASIVSVPADSTVGVGRAVEVVAYTETVRGEPEMTTATQETAPVQTGPNQGVIGWTAEERENAVRDLREEAASITELGRKHNMSDKASEYIRSGKTLSEFRGYVLENMGKDKRALQSFDIGLTQGEVRQFSIMRLAAAANPNATQSERSAAAFELEAVQAAADVASKAGMKTRGSQIPAEVLRDWVPHYLFGREYASRVINFVNDAALVPEDYRPGSFIDVLRNSSSIMQAGVTMLPGLVGTVDIPKKLTPSAATWVNGEGTNATESEPTFGNVTMTPRDLAVYTDITRRARQNMVPSIEAIIRQDIVMAIALALDLAAIEGTGLLGQPTGVRNVVGINKPTAFAGANPTFAETVALETMVADDNALQGNLAYILRTNMRGAMKTTEKFSTTGMTIWEPGNTINGHTAVVSNQITDGNLYFGNWSDVLLGMWSTLDLQFDYAALALSGGMRIIAFQTADVAVRRAESFAWNT